MQLHSMHRLFEANFSDQATRMYFTEYIYTNAGRDTDPCSWRGIHCTKNTIISLITTTLPLCDIPAEQRHFSNVRWVHWRISMDWLPPTLQAVHLNRLILTNGWLAERLPRDLRYFGAIECGNEPDCETDRVVRLNLLPRKLEELHIRGGWYRGDVALIDLPRTLQVLLLRNASFNSVFVDSPELPEKLKRVILYNENKAVEMQEISAGKVDIRVKWNKDHLYEFTERYCAFYEATQSYERYFFDRLV